MSWLITKICFLIFFTDIGTHLSSYETKPSIQQQNMVRYLIGEEWVGKLENLQGGGDLWQGHLIYLRFNASQKIIGSISKDYKKCEEADADLFKKQITKIKNPLTRLKFRPKWQINLSQPHQCYFWRGGNRWTSSGEHLLIYFPKSNTAYFRAFGI